MPGTTLGWYAIVCATLAIAWVIFGQRLQDAIREDVCPGRFCTGGREYVAAALLLGVPACGLGLAALVWKTPKPYVERCAVGALVGAIAGPVAADEMANASASGRIAGVKISLRTV